MRSKITKTIVATLAIFVLAACSADEDLMPIPDEDAVIDEGTIPTPPVGEIDDGLMPIPGEIGLE